MWRRLYFYLNKTRQRFSACSEVVPPNWMPRSSFFAAGSVLSSQRSPGILYRGSGTPIGLTSFLPFLFFKGIKRTHVRSLKIFAWPTICRRATSSKKGITIAESCSSGKDVSARKCSFLHPELAAAESLLSLKSILRIFWG